MKNKIVLPIALTLCVILVALTILDRSARAQGNLRHSADTGLVTPGPNQKLRLTAVAADAGDAMKVRFTIINYQQGNCAGNVCRSVVASRTKTGIINLAPGETAYLDGDPDRPVIVGLSRIVVEGSKPMAVNLQLVNTATGQVSSHTMDIDLYR